MNVYLFCSDQFISFFIIRAKQNQMLIAHMCFFFFLEINQGNICLLLLATSSPITLLSYLLF